VNEPPLLGADRVRIITGYSGAGKSAWVSQAAVHAAGTVAYFDVGDTPGPALMSALARELAGHLFGGKKGGLGEILLPGASATEILHAIGLRLADDRESAIVVLDNAHRLPPPDLLEVIRQGRQLSFLLLCQPGPCVPELEAMLSITSESLRGWSTDTIALEAAAGRCRGDLEACQRILDLTAGNPLYVKNAISITATEYDGFLSRFCDDIAKRTHTVETAQEVILARAFGSLPSTNQDGIGVIVARWRS
jgi:hypothetical protein